MTGADQASAAAAAEGWRETALYAPVKAFLEAQSFVVKGEVCGCDVVALRDGDAPVVVIAELKLSFTLELVLQAVERMRGADMLYLAVAASRRGRDQDARVTRLCRLLGVGLLVVDLPSGSVAVRCEPAPYRPRADLALRQRLLREHRARRGDPSVGGSTRRPIMTAYRQRALACAAAIGEGTARPRDLTHLAEDAGVILLRNVYGWFERVRPGHYRLTGPGHQAIAALSVAAPLPDGTP